MRGGLAAGSPKTGSPKTARALMQATGAGPMDNADEVVAKWIESVEARLRVLEHCANVIAQTSNPQNSNDPKTHEATPQTPKPPKTLSTPPPIRPPQANDT